MDTCSYSDCALAVRASFVVHIGWVYPHLTRYRHHRCCFEFHQGPEIA
jgi:hypothetical protein